MPIPSASQYTQTRRIQSDIAGKYSQSAVKLRAPNMYSSYSPFYAIPRLPVNALLSNKFISPSTQQDNGGGNTDLPPEWLLFDPNDPLSYDPANPTTFSNIGTYGAYSGTLSSTSNVQYLTGTNTSRKILYFNGLGRITFGAFDFGSSFTLTSWVRPLAKININAILATGPANANTEGFKFGWNTWTPTGDQNNSLIFENGGVGGANWGSVYTAQNTVTLNAWQHLAVVYDDTTDTARIFKNGVEIAGVGGNATSEIDLSSTSLSIGSYVGGGYTMKAELGLLKVFNSVLTDAEVAGDYNNTKASFGILNI